MVTRVYLDHAATTHMLPVAREAWLESSTHLGNASSLHTSGRSARRIVEQARESIAEDLRVRPSSVVFTGGGTEADNLAIKGLYWARCAELGTEKLSIVTSAVEHHAVLDPVLWLRDHEGADLVMLDVDPLGRVSVDQVDEILARGAVALVSVMWANNEIGTIQPVADIAAMCHKYKVPFHTDAVQALGQLDLNLDDRNITAVTVSSHKIGGPVGVGALIVDSHARVTPVLHGGGQEREVRSGTLDPAGVAAFAAAVHAVTQDLESHRIHLAQLQDYAITQIQKVIPEAIFNGPPPGPDRLPNSIHFSFPGCEGDSLLMLLDAAGIDCSTGSACTAGIPEPSHVLLAMNVDEKTARASLRFSLGRESTKSDIDALVSALPGVVDRALRAGSVAS